MKKSMTIRVKQGVGAVLATHIGKGKGRRALFITPWGVALDKFPKPPKNADLRDREYAVNVPAKIADAIRAALEAGHPGLQSRVEVAG